MEENKNVENEQIPVSPSDYKMMIDIVKEVESQYKALNATITEQLSSMYKLKSEVLEKIIPYPIDEIMLMTKEEIKEFLSKYTTDSEFLNDKDEEELREEIKTVKESSIVLYSTKLEADEIKENSSEVLNEYINYMTSDKVAKSRQKRLENMKKAAEVEENAGKKSEMLRMISTMEKSINYDYISERFDKLGEQEIKKVKDAYFDTNDSAYIKKKFDSKITKFGFRHDICKHFFNIEENFLPKKYSVFNNFLLFIYVRMVAYSDPYDSRDKIFVHSFTSALSNLIYHRFDTLATEENFIKVVEKILDLFEPYRDEFNEKNTTHENHPVRKQFEEEHEKKRKEVILKKIKDMRINNYDENMTADELQDIYNKEVDLMLRKQIKKDDEPLEIENSEEVTVSETEEESPQEHTENKVSEERLCR